MKKRLGFLLVALLIMPVLLTACDSESPDKAKEYMDAVLAGKVEEAQALACDEESAALTESVVAAYASQYPNMEIDTKNVDLKYDIGKGMNNKEVIVTGAFSYKFTQEGAAANPTDLEVEYELSDKLGTLVILYMDKKGDDWCVTSKSGFGVLGGEAAEGEAEAEGEAAEGEGK